jgi:hypothetical protein
MEPRQHRGIARRTADFDGIVFLGTVVGAEHVQPPGLGHLKRQAGGNDRVQRTDHIAKTGTGRQPGQIMGCGKTGRVVQWQHQCGGQQSRRLGQCDRGAVGVGGSVTQGFQRPFHRCAQIVRRIGNATHPVNRRKRVLSAFRPATP